MYNTPNEMLQDLWNNRGVLFGQVVQKGLLTLGLFTTMSVMMQSEQSKSLLDVTNTNWIHYAMSSNKEAILVEEQTFAKLSKNDELYPTH